MRSILLNHAEPMNAASAHAYKYDYKKKINVIRDVDGREIPLVDSNLDILCISTKTRSYNEADDTYNELLLISTKTYAQMESDDQGTTYYK